MSDFLSRLKSGATKVASEADRVARLTKAQTELSGLKHRLDGMYAELGKTVYDLQQGNQGDPATLDPMMQKITEQLHLIEEKNQAIAAIQNEGSVQPVAPAAVPPAVTPQASAASDTAAGAARTCPICGSSVPAQAKFCGTCGNRM